MNPKRSVPEYSYQIVTGKKQPTDDHKQSVWSGKSDKTQAFISEIDSEDMWSFTPVINSNYQLDYSEGPVYERLLKAGEYYKRKLDKRKEDKMKAKQQEENLIISGIHSTLFL